MKGIADYRFVELLGEGNHGTFWKADAPDRLGVDAEHVAVKVLAHRASDDDVARFGRELRHYSRVVAEELVPLLDAGHQEGRLFYATPWYRRGSLDASVGALGRSEVLTAVADAARAAHALHESGIAHRDIKPANITLTEDGRGRLGDLGLAQALSPGKTITGIGPVGAIEYLAPELVRGDRASRASDVWALGATLHRALTGRSLYPGLPGDLLAALRHVVTGRPVIDSLASDAETEAIAWALEAEATGRPPTALQFAERLDSLTEVAR
ncbi:MAG: serine/threonine-protein kinase [Actinomycetota bacterium]